MIGADILAGILKWAILFVAGSLLGWNLSNALRVKPLQLQFDTFKFAVNSKGAKQEVRVERVTQEIPVLQEVGRKEDAAKIGDLGVRLRIALDELRNERNGRSRLKDANAAPAECRDYGADPRQLPVPYAEFLIGEASRAERIIVQRDACFRDYGTAKQKLDELAASAARP